MSPEEEEKKRKKSREIVPAMINAFFIYSFIGFFIYQSTNDEFKAKYNWLMIPIFMLFLLGGSNFGGEVYERYFEKWHIELINKREVKQKAKEAAKKAKEEKKG